MSCPGPGSPDSSGTTVNLKQMQSSIHIEQLEMSVKKGRRNWKKKKYIVYVS